MQSVQEKFDAIHQDLEANVTKIYQRRDLMVMFDLVAHSVIKFEFGGDYLRKGWVECLVIGDTRCGKSETIEKLMGHYRCGEIVTGESATYAGLVGGLQQTQKTWSITWGKIPLNDRRMLNIDELSGLSQEHISRMSGIRSSGVAEITKIQTERTLARCRLLWSSNPRGKRPMAAFTSGIAAIEDLIGHPEDIARFDAAMTVALGEVPLSVINAKTRNHVPHVHTSEACRQLVYWAWSRKPDQVVWAPGAQDRVLDVATDLSRKYVAPLVEGAEQRVKVARLSVAAAARVFSATSDGECVYVTTDHVDFVQQYLVRIYNKPSMAFDLYSHAKLSETTLHDPKAIQEQLERLPADFRGLLNDAPSFTAADLQDFAGVSRDGANELASFLVRRRCIRKGKFGYYKLPAFIRFLREYRTGNQFADADAPF